MIKYPAVTKYTALVSGPIDGHYEVPVLTVREAATEMGLSAVRVRQLCQDGRIKGAVKLGGWAWMIPTPIVRYQPPRGRPPIGEPHPSDSR